jgi:thiol-disulfide isomerase/thioredoxin
MDQLKATLASQQRPVVVHHWATWCDACVEELPGVDALVERLGDAAQVLGVSWELFEPFGQEEFEVVGGLAKYAMDQGLTMPTLVYRGEPESLFAGLALDFEQIPQTRVFDALGNELCAFKGPMTGEDLAAVVELVAATP